MTRSNPSRAAIAAFALMLSMACEREAPTPPPTAEASPASKPPSRPAEADPDDWCREHAVPESMCTLCNPGLRAAFVAAGDFCGPHELPESVCPLCNPLAPPAGMPAHPHAGAGHGFQPEAAAAPTRPARADASDWCREHAVPESMCTLCNPGLRAAFVAAGDFCGPHELPESVCPLCNPLAPPAEMPAHPHAGAGHGFQPEAPSGIAAVEPTPIAPGTRVRLRSADHERAVGIATIAAVEAAIGDTLTVPARLDFDRDRYAEVRPAVAGMVREVRVDWGAEVAAGDVLFVLESAHVGELQARADAARARSRAARTALARRQTLRDDGISSAGALEDARRELATARAELAGVERSLALSGATSAEDAGRFAVTAPRAGTVVRRPAVVGMFAEASDLLAVVADPTSKWARLAVGSWHAGDLAVGLPVSLRVEAAAAFDEFEGRVTWISPEVDPRTRTVEVRAAVADPEARLRAQQFGEATIALAPAAPAVAVPPDAVQRFEAGAIVFVRLEAGLYEPRRVTLGRADQRLVQVRGDLRAGEPVVTTGAYLLRTELDRGAIGAGCCETD